jgi:hypothetical protein
LLATTFISYRRGDTAPQAGRLYDLLIERFGQQSVFMDVDSIEPGADFVRAINSAIAGSSTAIILIGRNWLSSRTSKGARRLDNASDYVRVEIETAIESGLHVVPLLINGATMPRPDELPGRMRPLCTRNALIVDDISFRRDVAPVLELLVARFKDSSRLPSGDTSRTQRSHKRWTANILYNQLGVMKDPKWGALLRSPSREYRIEFGSTLISRRIRVNGRTEWTGGLRDVSRCKIAIRDGDDTHLLSFGGGACEKWFPENNDWVIRVDGADVLHFV